MKQSRILALAAAWLLGLAAPAVVVAEMDTSAVGGEASLQLAKRQARRAIEDGDYSAAVRTLEEALASAPDDADVNNMMGYSLRKMGRFSRAERHYLRALRTDPSHIGANEYLGELYVETGRLAKARERLAVLSSVCGDCEAYRELKAEIDGGGE